jgi:hypothetical protein
VNTLLVRVCLRQIQLFGMSTQATPPVTTEELCL